MAEIRFRRGNRNTLYVLRAEPTHAIDPGQPMDLYQSVATESDLAAAGFVRASRLAAAEAMAEDARKLADAWEHGTVHGDAISDIAQRVLASRPSEQVDAKVRCSSGWVVGDDSQFFVLKAGPVAICEQCVAQCTLLHCRAPSRERAYRREMPRGAGWTLCQSVWHQDSNAAGAGSANVSGTSGVAPAVENTGHLLSLSELSLSLGKAQGEAEGHRIQREYSERRVQELKTQLAEAKMYRDVFDKQRGSLLDGWTENVRELHERLTSELADAEVSRERDELRAKLEAAEAERAHLLEAAEILRRCERHNRDEEHLTLEAMNHLMHTELFDWYERDQSRAATTEEPFA